jgi:ABC-type branched-subunit amino acid transport system substrate-binding protein
MRARPRVLIVGLCVVLATAIAGCSGQTSSSSSSVDATGGTLKIFASVPPTARTDAQQADVIDAEQLAFKQNESEVKDYKVSLVPERQYEISANARAAIQDNGAIAYIGELAPGASEDTVGITNALDILQVSPTDTAVELTQVTPGTGNTPNKYYESEGTYGRTFARVVPNSLAEAKALVAEMQSLKVNDLYVADDGSDYGVGLAGAVRQDAKAASITVASGESGANGVFYAAQAPAAAETFFKAAASQASAAKWFGPSSLATSAFASAMSATGHQIYISEPGQLPGAMAATGRKFRSDFDATYGHEPAVDAAFGYAAVAAVLHVLAEAGEKADDRTTVLKDFLKLKLSDSVLGPYSIDSSGDTSFGSFVFNRLSAGALVPIKSQ